MPLGRWCLCSCSLSYCCTFAELERGFSDCEPTDHVGLDNDWFTEYDYHLFSNKSSSAPTFGKVVRILRILIVLGILSVDIFTMILNYFQVENMFIIKTAFYLWTKKILTVSWTKSEL